VPGEDPHPRAAVEHRRRAASQGLDTAGERAAIGAFAFVAERPALWSSLTAAGRAAGQLLRDGMSLRGGWLPLLSVWLRERDFPAPAQRAFRERWRAGVEREPVNPDPPRGTS
jgi:L-lactate dehydrogenase complex protein LldF